jgi:hypothetical protein
MLYLSSSASLVYRPYYLRFGARIKAETQEWEERLLRCCPRNKGPAKDLQLERHNLRKLMKQEFPLANLRLLLRAAMKEESA